MRTIQHSIAGSALSGASRRLGMVFNAATGAQRDVKKSDGMFKPG